MLGARVEFLRHSYFIEQQHHCHGIAVPTLKVDRILSFCAAQKATEYLQVLWGNIIRKSIS